ncbi:hypothetical protein ECH_0081 [Ehrlichia chaffeensis str. Arkansas]|uniref:Uncharacterized protein n=1 Tax=Ehrlichia chaffeensis (strain ATCC CRL-10679 / Arkansas) TaxID=205920 RepID=Q2GI22_EHRCR|nr:hypothetical protein ECH_0081 [Ehrlichia chaffeensis str. Arkansas]
MWFSEFCALEKENVNFTEKHFFNIFNLELV